MAKKRPDPETQAADVPATDLQELFGANLRNVRKAAGLTQAEVAGRSGIAQAEISLIEHGRINLTMARMRRLAMVFGYDVSILLTNTPTQPL